MTTDANTVGIPAEALAGTAWLLDPCVPRRDRVLAVVGSLQLRHTLVALRRWALVDHQDEPTEAGVRFAHGVTEAAQHAPDGLFPGATGGAR